VFSFWDDSGGTRYRGVTGLVLGWGRLGDLGRDNGGLCIDPITMSLSASACPQCTLANTYPDGANFVCADCGFEWPQAAAAEDDTEADAVVKDANGNVLADGDAVVLIKDLKVKGSSITLKVGTKVKSIRLVGGDHGVDCKMDAGSFMLKACFLKKV
jgi:protein PhnA